MGKFISKPVRWTLKEALALVRSIQEDSREFGYHVCLGGGVLNTGSSQKDLDIYFLPLDNTDDGADPEGALAWAESLWGKAAPVSTYPLTPASLYAHKVKFVEGETQRIDLFIMRRTA